jgi:ATP-binding protein involved in chromosome partitioning
VTAPAARHVVAVGSGKGGVGKSTVTLNLAFALRRRGWNVGLLDADLYGPDIPLMLNLKREQEA